MKTALIGDSHAKVIFKTLVPLLKQAGFTPVYGKAQNGWSLKKHISQGTLAEMRRAKPDLIVVSLGGNNQDMKAQSYAQTVKSLVQMANNVGAQIIWFGPTTSNFGLAPNTEKRHKWTDQFLSQVVPKFGTYISMREFTTGNWGKDGVHYSPSRYKEWARKAYSDILNMKQPLSKKIKKNAKPILISTGIAISSFFFFKLLRRNRP